jgi:cyanophycin synthetase
LMKLHDKAAIRAILSRAGIAVPRQIVINLGEIRKALNMLQSFGVPLVVKPSSNTGSGAGVSTGVTHVRQLYTAVAWARAFGPRIVIEEQIPGDCYRVLVMDGQVLDTVVRHPPTVFGDGVSTVRELVRRENRERLKQGAVRAQVLIRVDPDLHNTLARQGLSLVSRPAKGKAVVLKGVINDNNRHENTSSGRPLCPAILQCAVRAAKLVGLRLAGVDLVCADPTIALERSGGALLEVNANPGFYYHYYKVDSSFAAADHVLSRFFRGAIE